MTQTETPRKVTTAEEAVDVLNEKQYCQLSWELEGAIVRSETVHNGTPIYGGLSENEAVVLANHLSGYYDALEAENQQLKAKLNRHATWFGSLIATLKQQKKDAFALCKWLCVGSTVAQEIWATYDRDAQKATEVESK